MRNVVEQVDEIITKEYEKHELLYWGFPPESVLKETLSSKFENMDDFSGLRKIIILSLYQQLDFTSFVEKEKRMDYSHNKFRNTLRLFLKQNLADLQKEKPSVLDINIGLGKNVSFLLSTMLFSGIYKTFRESDIKFETPAALKEFLVSTSLNIFPIKFQPFIEQLKKEDDEFWAIVYKLLLKLSTTVTYNHIWSSVYKDIAKDEITSESYIVLNKEIINKENIPFDDSTHFRRYSHRVCINKMHEYNRKNKNINLTDSLEENIELTDSRLNEICDDDSEELEYFEVDVNNKYKLARLSAIILLNSNHPLHEQLVDREGKDKINLLIDVSVNGLSYEEIIEERIKAGLSDKDKKRMNANLRQEYSRVKQTIVKRLKEILEKNENMYSYKR